MPLFERLQEKYGARDVEVLNIYFREPHAGENYFKAYKQPDTYEEKMAYARELVETKRMSLPVLVDGIDGSLQDALGGLPNIVYVVGKDGRVHYKSSWADADKVDRALAELVTADDPSRPVEPTFETQDVGIDI